MSRRQWPSLPDELIQEILLKLPVTSLLRFRCVSKSWKTLISHPQFVKDQLHTAISDHHPPRLASSVEDGFNEIVTCSVQELFENPLTPAATLTFKMDCTYTIVGSIHGLVCLRDLGGFFRLWNPSTRMKSKRSPPPPASIRRYTTHVGFGYDQVNGKYKVFVNALHDSRNETRVHTFGTHSWTTIEGFPDSRASVGMIVGKFVSGTLNWLPQSMIISFDVEKETCGEVSLPPPAGHGVWAESSEMDILNDCLSLCVHHHYYTHCKYCWVVWSMKKYGVHESWSKLMVIPLEKLIIPRDLPAFHPLCIFENGIVLAKAMNSVLLMYNQNNGTSHYADIIGRFGQHIQVYHESLVSP